MSDQFTGIRFLIIEDSDIGESVIDEYDVGFNDIEEMRRNLLQHIQELKNEHPEKNYILREDNEDSPDESQQIQP